MTLGCAMAMLALAPCSPVFASAGAGMSREAAVDQNWYMVTDRAGILDENQERSAINDAYRLFLHGIPTQVVTENASLNQDQADARARELRITRAIESFRGANDGLLFYAAVDPRNRNSIVMSISVGGTTLPNNGLNSQSLQGVRDTVMATQLAAGRPARAIVYSLREIIYLEQYVPPAVPPVTGWKAAVQRAIVVIGPTLALSGSLWLTWQRWRDSMTGPFAIISLTAGALAAIGILLLSIPAHSTVGVFSALALGVVVIWNAIALDTRKPASGIRPIWVAPRVPRPRMAGARRSRTGHR